MPVLPLLDWCQLTAPAAAGVFSARGTASCKYFLFCFKRRDSCCSPFPLILFANEGQLQLPLVLTFPKAKTPISCLPSLPTLLLHAACCRLLLLPLPAPTSRSSPVSKVYPAAAAPPPHPAQASVAATASQFTKHQDTDIVLVHQQQQDFSKKLATPAFAATAPCLPLLLLLPLSRPVASCSSPLRPKAPCPSPSASQLLLPLVLTIKRQKTDRSGLLHE